MAVSCATGELILRACVTDDIAVGAVSIPHGFPDANVNRLVSATVLVDAISGMPLQAGTPVSIRPA